jgi:hypothetical protein
MKNVIKPLPGFKRFASSPKKALPTVSAWPHRAWAGKRASNGVKKSTRLPSIFISNKRPPAIRQP